MGDKERQKKIQARMPDPDAFRVLDGSMQLFSVKPGNDASQPDGSDVAKNKEKNRDIGDIDGYFETEIEECNFFMKQNKITADLPNVLWAFKSSIMAVLFKPMLKFFDDMKAFSIQKIKDSSYVLRCFSKHMPLFISFDNNRLSNDRWSVHDLNEKSVELLLRIDPSAEDGSKIIDLVKNAAMQARNEGWEGKLVLLIIESLPIAM